jgi:hypothetical protein
LNENLFKQIQIYEINTRIFCKENECTLEDLPESFFESSEYGASDLIWLMGIWKPSPSSVSIAKTHDGLQREYKHVLSDLTEEDVIGSPYSIYEYSPNPSICQNISKVRQLKKRLEEDGKKLILDFVPNHMAIDSPLIDAFPDLFLEKESGDVCHNSFRHTNRKVYYYGRDPYFDGWSDTIQWDFSKQGTQKLHTEILLEIADACHGVRCDMAMLPQKDIFQKTHGKEAEEYWKPIILSVKEKYPSFLFIGEVYWNREYELQQMGFDYTYDKELYDRLKTKSGRDIVLHLSADLDYQKKSVRFLENHDEERAAHTFGEKSIYMMSLLNFLPGAILTYEGQSLGMTKKIPVQLGRRPDEPLRAGFYEYYQRAFLRLMIRKKYDVKMASAYFCCYEIDSYDPIISRILFYLTEKQIGMAKVKIYNLEILVYNPEDREISGWLVFDKTTKDFIESLFYDNIELEDIITSKTYRKTKKEILETGIFIKLPPKEGHWFVIDSDLLKEMNAMM